MKTKYQKISIQILAIVLLFMGGTSCGSKKPKTTDSGKEITLRLEPGEGNPRNSEGDFIQLNNGQILFIYSHFTGGTGDNASAYLAGRISNDNGKSWSNEDVQILENEGGMNVMSVSLLRLQNDELALFYLRKNSEDDCIPFIRFSTDEAKTWSEPVRCIAGDGYFVVNNDRLVLLKNGRIIFSAAQHEAPNWANGKITSCYSDDNGKTWAQSTQVANPENIVLQEPGIVELKNGQLMMFCRTDAGVQYFSYSSNNGESWTPIEPGNIKSPLSPASIERIPETGDLLLLWNNNYEQVGDGGKRTPFNLAISKDEGKTWEKIKAVESDPEGWYCYTAIEFIGGHVLLGHCAGDRRTNNGLSTTQITRLSLDWIYREATPNPTVISDNGGIITLGCPDKDAQVHYTLDGTIPSDSTGLLYVEPIIVNKTMPLNMIAFKPGMPSSQIVLSYIGSDVFQWPQHLTHESGQGIIYYYYEGEVHEASKIEKIPFIESKVIPRFSIENSRRVTNFAYVFEGYIKISQDGRYTFYLKSNDGSVLYLDDYKLIDNDGAHGIYEQTSSISLMAGMRKISVSYFQLGGESFLKAMWSGPGFEKQEIPASVLFH